MVNLRSTNAGCKAKKWRQSILSKILIDSLPVVIFSFHQVVWLEYSNNNGSGNSSSGEKGLITKYHHQYIGRTKSYQNLQNNYGCRGGRNSTIKHHSVILSL
ncbi:hypothetical protein ACTA71_001261 [Dictyostelium dimigraforme]